MSYLVERPYSRPILEPLRIAKPTDPMTESTSAIRQKLLPPPTTSSAWTATTHSYIGTLDRVIPRSWPPSRFGDDPASLPDDDKYNVYYDPKTALPRPGNIYRLISDDPPTAGSQITPTSVAVPPPRLVVKRYIPNTTPPSGAKPGNNDAVTLFFGPGFLMAKEMLEPMIELVVSQLHAASVHVEEVWSIDMPFGGETALANPIGYLYGDEKDIARDLLIFFTSYLPVHAGGDLPEELEPRHPTSLTTPQPTRRNLHVITHSMPTMCTLFCASHAPDLFASLTVFDPAMLAPGPLYEKFAAVDKTTWQLGLEPAYPSREALTAAVRANWRTQGMTEHAIRTFVEREAVPVSSDDKNGAVRLVVNPHLQWALFYDKESCAQCWDRFEDVRMPLHVVMPGRPIVMHVKAVAAALEKMKQMTRLSRVEDTTHLLIFEEPEKCAEVVGNWLLDVINSNTTSKPPRSRL